MSAHGDYSGKQQFPSPVKKMLFMPTSCFSVTAKSVNVNDGTFSGKSNDGEPEQYSFEDYTGTLQTSPATNLSCIKLFQILPPREGISKDWHLGRPKSQNLRRASSWRHKKQSVRMTLRRRSESDTLFPESSPSSPFSAWSCEDGSNPALSGSQKESTTQFYYTTPPRVNMTPNLNGEKREERHLSKRYSLGGDYHKSEHRTPPVPSSAAAMNTYFSTSKVTRNSSTSPRKKGHTDSDPAALAMGRRRSERRSAHDTNTLFDAVEHQDLDQVKLILETNGLDVNCENSENLTPLDVAVMTNNIPIAKLLLCHGAKENSLFQEDRRSARLDFLISDSERKVVDLMAVVLNGSSGSNALSSVHQKENERQLSDCEFRHKLLKRMKAGYNLARAPDPPTNVTLSVASSCSLLLHFNEPLNHNGAVVTRYKRKAVVEDLRQLEYEITGLKKDQGYFVQVAAWNMKGYGAYASANPAYAVPSSWRDEEESVVPSTEGKLKALEELFAQVRLSRPVDAPAIKGPFGESSAQKKRKSLKNLFSLTPKFQKNLRRGIYLACLLYHEDKILVTPEEQLPVIEVDENFTGTSIYPDFHWMMKIACTWDDVKSLRHDMDKSNSAGTAHFRSRLLQAAILLQNALGIHDLGQFYYQPLKTNNGSTVLVTVKKVKEPKFVALASGKWMSLAKLQRRLTLIGQECGEPHDLLNSASDMILHNEVSSVKLPKGLYLGYLKLRSSVDLIRVLVPQKHSNMLPCVRIRNCPNVSREEWEWIQHLNENTVLLQISDEAQKEFHRSIVKASKELFDLMGLPNDATNHRIYNLEVIELSKEVSFLLLLPPVEDVCVVPGHDGHLPSHNHLCAISVQLFEINHMNTYHPEFISLYSRVSSLLESDLSLAQQSQREAFLPDELNTAKERVDFMSSLQSDLEALWKGMRWIMDIITFARDKTKKSGISLEALYSLPWVTKSSSNADSSKLFENNNSLPSNASARYDSNLISVGKDKRKVAKFYDPTEELHNPSACTKEPEGKSQSADNSHSEIIRVYAGYETGLARGTSVRLCITQKTTAQEVTSLVIQQLNKEVHSRNKEGPTYTPKQYANFCLIVAVGTREKVLQGDSLPLSLQAPWKKGHFYVQMKADVRPFALKNTQATAV